MRYTRIDWLRGFGLLLLITAYVFGTIVFADELRRASEQRQRMDYTRFQRDSLQVEVYKKQLTQ